mmetsp:Transcript_15168/g.51156  ORF Transcript_15168/g.51156 Transcript_15168/m.51156 type:complete len:82 (-) Transcript_15168:324-569(-)
MMYGSYGLSTIWNWQGEILPCRVYLRHCVLACSKAGEEVKEDFLVNTFLWDRKTTIKEYLQANPSIMEEEPPESLRHRYSG